MLLLIVVLVGMMNAVSERLFSAAIFNKVSSLRGHSLLVVGVRRQTAAGFPWKGVLEKESTWKQGTVV